MRVGRSVLGNHYGASGETFIPPGVTWKRQQHGRIRILAEVASLSNRDRAEDA